jgi:hypothetical protein
VLAAGHAGQRRERLALRPGRHEQHLLLGQLHRLVQVDEQPLGHVEQAQVGGDAHVADHRPADERDPPAVAHGHVEHLLHAVHVAREARDDHPLLGAGDHALEHRPDLALRHDEARHLGVGGVHEEQVDALVTEAGEACEVGEPAVERQLVELDVTGVQDQPGRGAHGDRQRVRDGVVDREELALEVPVGNPAALDDLDEVRGEPVFPALGGDQRECEPRAHHRQVGAVAQQERHGADVVLVAVGEHDRVDVVHAGLDRAEVRQDQVDARLLVLGEEHAAVDDEQAPAVLEHGHVPADFADPAECDDAEPAVRERTGWGELCHRWTCPALVWVVVAT